MYSSRTCFRFLLAFVFLTTILYLFFLNVDQLADYPGHDDDKLIKVNRRIENHTTNQGIASNRQAKASSSILPQSTTTTPKPKPKKIEKLADASKKIVIGTVCCREDKKYMGCLQEAEVMIKSVLISAVLYKVAQVEIHLLLEHPDDNKFFLDRKKEIGAEGKGVEVIFQFHSAVEPVPEKYREKMIFHKRYRCGHSRLYFPSALPEVDSILYLDTDSIITGNVWELWKHVDHFEKNPSQMIGVVANNQPISPGPNHTSGVCFAGYPFIKPDGVNSGLILMNLTRLRKYGWEDKLHKVWDSYVPKRRSRIDDQSLLNILLRADISIYLQIPCQFNVKCTNCDHAMICKSAEEDPYGVQCIHGANSQFRKGLRFHYIYQRYEQFNMQNESILKDLMVPIRNSKEPVTRWDKCNVPLNPHLFRNWF